MATRMLVVAVLTIAMAPAALLGKEISVTVRNVPIAATGTVENGHIMLPLRASFETLDSTVWYESKTGLIEARNILHVLRLRIGSSTAYLDGHARHLETPPHVINGSVYIPVAFAAEAMGAIVRYDPQANVLAVNGSPVSSEPHVAYNAPHQALSNAVALSVDGYDVTPNAVFDGHTIKYRQWSFVTTRGFGFGLGVIGNGVTIIAPPTGTGFGTATGCGVNVIQPFWTGGWRASPVCATPILQPIFVPVFVP